MNKLVSRWLLAAAGLCALAGCGTSTEALAQKVKSADPAERLRAVQELRRRSGEADKVIPVLVAALDDADGFVRRDAARALAQFGAHAQTAAPALKGRLADRQPSVRRAAAAALKEIDVGRKAP